MRKLSIALFCYCKFFFLLIYRGTAFVSEEDSFVSTTTDNKNISIRRRRRRRRKVLDTTRSSDAIITIEKGLAMPENHANINNVHNLHDVQGTREEVENMEDLLFEGDIIPDYTMIMSNYGPDVVQQLRDQGFQLDYLTTEEARKNLNVSRRWPTRVNDVVEIPYAIVKDGYIASQIDLINQAVEELGERAKVIKFVPRTNESNYIEVYSGRSCSSTVGRIAGVGPQKLSLMSKGCIHYATIQHEFMHALGIFHEQSRPDRDDYVVINFENIEDNQKHNFDKRKWSKTLGNPYDYGSVMHYGKTDFSKNGLDTITTLHGETIGQSIGASDSDIVDIRLMYQCVSGARTLSEYNSNRCTSTCKCWENEFGCNGDSDACQGSLVCKKNKCITLSKPPISAVCGDDFCQVNRGEGCSSCEADCFIGTHCNAINTQYQGGLVESMAYGIVFDVTVKKDLYFYELDTRLMSYAEDVVVYMKEGSYTTDTNLGNWDMVFSEFVSYNSDSGWWPVSLSTKFFAAAGSKVAIYLSYNSSGTFIYSDDGETSNDDVTIETGSLVGEQMDNFLPPVVGDYSDFVGKIKYDYAPEVVQCIEDPEAIIFGRVAPGNMLQGTCSQLAALPKFIDTACSMDLRSAAEKYSPAAKCPQTCGTAGNVNDNASESPRTKILGLVEKDDGSPVVHEKNCGWLSRQRRGLIRAACNLDFSLWDKYAASDVCCETCGS